MALSNPTFLNAFREIGNSGTVNLTWDYAPNNGYIIYRSENNNAFVPIHTVEADIGFGEGPLGFGPYGQAYSNIITWDDPNASPFNNYFYSIASFDATANEALLNPTLSSEIYQLQPKWIEATNFRFDSGIDIYWDEVPTCSKYRIYNTTNNGSRSYIVQITGHNFTHYNINSLSHLDNHLFEIEAIMDNGDVSETTVAPLFERRFPQPVENLTITKNLKTFDLSWNNIEEGDNVEIYMSTNGKSYSLIDTLSPNETTYNVAAGLDLRNFYKFAIKQINSSGGALTVSNKESISDGVNTSWSPGINSNGNETFEVSKKIPENSCIFPELKPVIISSSEPCGILSPKKQWTILYDDTTTNYSESSPDRGSFQMYSVRAKDPSFNYSKRVILETQI